MADQQPILSAGSEEHFKGRSGARDLGAPSSAIPYSTMPARRKHPVIQKRCSTKLQIAQGVGARSGTGTVSCALFWRRPSGDRAVLAAHRFERLAEGIIRGRLRTIVVQSHTWGPVSLTQRPRSKSVPGKRSLCPHPICARDPVKAPVAKVQFVPQRHLLLRSRAAPQEFNGTVTSARSGSRGESVAARCRRQSIPRQRCEQHARLMRLRSVRGDRNHHWST